MSDNEDDFIQINTTTTANKLKKKATTTQLKSSQDPIRKTLNNTIKKPEKFERKVKH
jgi:hypothetical protein